MLKPNILPDRICGGQGECEAAAGSIEVANMKHLSYCLAVLMS